MFVRSGIQTDKSSPQSFSVPGIMFPARRNIYSCHFTVWCFPCLVIVIHARKVFPIHSSSTREGIYVPSGWKHYARDRKTLRRTFVSWGKMVAFFDLKNAFPWPKYESSRMPWEEGEAQRNAFLHTAARTAWFSFVLSLVGSQIRI